MNKIEPNFKVGDTVILKSGSPLMTVSKLELDIINGGGVTGKVFCKWFIGDEKPLTEKFHQDTLILEE